MTAIDLERVYMNDYWSFRKKFYEVKDSDEYWTAVIEESDALVKKYDCNDYLMGIVLLCVNDLDRRYRQENIGKNPSITFVPGTLVTQVYKRIMTNIRKEECA